MHDLHPADKALKSQSFGIAASANKAGRVDHSHSFAKDVPNILKSVIHIHAPFKTLYPFRKFQHVSTVLQD